MPIIALFKPCRAEDLAAVKEKDKDKKKISYPCYKEYFRSHLILAFNDERIG